MTNLLKQLQKDFPRLVFSPHEQFCWSPKTNEILYHTKSLSDVTGQWALLHEVAHAVLEHNSYESDLELIQLEAAAWEKAKEMAPEYTLTIDENHIQDCLDTYRDWLHQRSACPKCNARSLQQDAHTYRCFNCSQVWQVSSSRFCRPYRLTKQTKTPPSVTKATFV